MDHPSSGTQQPTAFATASRLGPEDLQRQAELFRQDTNRFGLLDTVPDGMVITNQHRQIVHANRAFLKLCKITSLSDILGRRAGEILKCIRSDNKNGGCGTSAHCGACGATAALLEGIEGQESVREVRMLNADSVAMDLKVWVTPVTIMSENFCIMAIKDISVDKRQRVLERIFFHDVLNTVGTLQQISELLGHQKARDHASEAESELLSMLPRITTRLVDEIESHRLLLSAENESLSVRVKPQKIATLVNDVQQFYLNHAVSDGRTINISELSHKGAFNSDGALVLRILGNLVKNALEASDTGQTVSIRAFCDDGLATFEVHNPKVMPTEVQLQIFQRSFSTKGSGRGIGTYSVKLLTEKYLKGQVTFTSEEGKGTTFRVDLPSLNLPDRPMDSRR